jgi:hypothetical protein
MRGTRLKACLIGCARSDMTLSWIWRVRRASSGELDALAVGGRQPVGEDRVADHQLADEVEQQIELAEIDADRLRGFARRLGRRAADRG